MDQHYHMGRVVRQYFYCIFLSGLLKAIMSSSLQTTETTSHLSTFQSSKPTAGVLTTFLNANQEYQTSSDQHHPHHKTNHDTHKNHHSDYGKSYKNLRHNNHRHQKNHGDDHWANHHSNSHGSLKNHYKKGSEGDHWDDWKERETYKKDKGHGFIKAFTWDREEGTKDRFGSKGGRHSDHSSGGNSKNYGHFVDDHKGHKKWEDIQDYGILDNVNAGNVWSADGLNYDDIWAAQMVHG